MISAIAWLPLGVAAEDPQHAEPPDDELAEVMARVEAKGGMGRMRRAKANEDSDSDDEWEEMGSDELAEMEQEDAEEDDAEQDPGEEESDDPDAGKKAAKRAAAVAAAAQGGAGSIDAAMAELEMDKYDDDDDAADASAARLFGGGRAMFHDTNDDDPYMTVKDEEDENDEDYPDDFTMRPTDLVMLAARTDDDVSHLEVYVYEEPVLNGSEEANLYCHHDLLLPAFPLSLAWMDCPADGREGGRANCVAVGTMYPGIEIWDLDVIEAVEPVATLGGYDEKDVKRGSGAGLGGSGDGQQGKKVTSRQAKKNAKAAKAAAPALKSDGHSDAVLDLSWNAQYRNVLASASADKTVRVWDVATRQTQHVLTHHSGKVQAAEWNPVEPTVLLTGGFDRVAAAVDVRAPSKAAMRWTLDADVECAVWNLADPTQVLVSDESGTVTCFDTRNGGESAPIFSLAAHDKATTSMSLCPGASSLLLTGSTDKCLKLWDIAGGKPSLMATNTPAVGAVFSVGFAPSVPYLVACAGSKGEVAVWDVLSEQAVAQSPHGPALEKYNRALALEETNKNAP